MFVQVIKGRVKDAAAIREASDRWELDLRAGAKGYLGSTSGVSDDGIFVNVVRFESEDGARASSERPEQTAWWEGTSKLFEGSPVFYDCPRVESYMDGVRDDAGFVQLEIFTGVKDVDAFNAVSREFEKVAHLRPELLGVTAAATSDGTVFGTNYFSSEAAAREGESREPPAEVVALVQRWEELIDGVDYVDLRDPWFDSP